MWKLPWWLAAGALACSAAATATDSAAPLTPVAQSALVTVEAASTPAGLTLRLRRTAGTAPLVVTGLGVSVDGAALPAARSADGSWSVAWPSALAHRAGRLEVVVSHDGIRELLSGILPAAAAGAGPAAGDAAALWRTHKQLAWWVLNIAIVLIAAVAISRRLS